MTDADGPRVRVERIGAEGEPVVVVENFSAHPDRLVAEAAASSFAAMGPFYPGVRARVGPSYMDGLGSILAPAMRDVFGYHRRLVFDRALYSIVTTPPDLLSLPQRIPHVDGVEDGKIAILHYLSREDRGGTSFFRHRATGYETVSAARHRAYLDALQADFARLGEPPAGYIAGDTPIFSRIAHFAPAYNRALIYRSALLHCAAVPDDAMFGANPRDGRLTVASFLTAQ